MDTDALRQLHLLKEIAGSSRITQRTLAERCGVALGLTNLMIRRLVGKGHVKIVSLPRNRILYMITPKGLVQLTRLTYEYLEYSLFLYRRVRDVLRETSRGLINSGGRRIVIMGAGELGEIAYLTLREQGLELAGVVDDKLAGANFLGLPVHAFDALPQLQFDYAIVSALDNGLPELRRRLGRLGIPEQKIVVVEQNRTQIRAVSLAGHQRVKPGAAAGNRRAEGVAAAVNVL